MMTVPYQARSARFRSSDPRLDQYDNISPSKLFTDNSFSNLCHALSLIHDTFVNWRILWSTCEDWRAFGDNQREVMWHTGSDRSPATATLSSYSFSEAYRLFRKRLDSKRVGVDIAIDRWVESKREVGLSDQFIDLRIALESLYLSESGSELSFRLATHGAWHLGTKFEERQVHYKTLRDAYSTASTAVHTGSIEHTERNLQLLADAQGLCRQGILKRLDESKDPDWNALILGKELDAAATKDDET